MEASSGRRAWAKRLLPLSLDMADAVVSAAAVVVVVVVAFVAFVVAFAVVVVVGLLSEQPNHLCRP